VVAYRQACVGGVSTRWCLSAVRDQRPVRGTGVGVHVPAQPGKEQALQHPVCGRPRLPGCSWLGERRERAPAAGGRSGNHPDAI